MKVKFTISYTFKCLVRLFCSYIYSNNSICLPMHVPIVLSHMSMHITRDCACMHMVYSLNLIFNLVLLFI